MEGIFANQDEPPFKRGKRAKYAQRACPQCQRRKIKCDGNIPCSPCVARKRNCGTAGTPNSMTDRRNSSIKASTSAPNESSPEGHSVSVASKVPADVTNPSMGELLDRIMSLERRLAASAPNHLGSSPDQEASQTPSHSNWISKGNVGTPELSPFADNSDRQTFVGEASMQALRDPEMHFEDGSESCLDSPISNGYSLTPKLHGNLAADKKKSSRDWLRAILLSYEITPQKSQYDAFMRIFFDEIHILYPFLHPPTVWQTYEYLWQRSLLISSDDLEYGDESKMSVAIVFICLALGRCTSSSRAENIDGSHSAGWSLYSVATDLLSPMLDLRFHVSPSLQSLQAFALMVIYLFRLDATEKAGHILLNAVSGAHFLALHRRSSLVNLPIYEDEMFTRLWWCLYLLDRRVSLETGRPFIIQDTNNERRLPFNVRDEWLQKHRSTSKNAVEMADEISAEISAEGHPVTSYWEAMITTSRVVGDLWRIMYNDEQASQGSSSMARDYLDILLEDSRSRLPNFLRFRPGVPFKEQFAGQDWWQIKQCLFLNLRYSLLKLLIRRVVAKSSLNPTEIMAQDSFCAQLAASCIRIVDDIPEECPKYAFTFVHYIISASMILLSIIVKDPKFKDTYHNSLVTAARILSVYCRKTWVSGKMIRTVSELNKLVRHLLLHQETRHLQQKPDGGLLKKPENQSQTARSNDATPTSFPQSDARGYGALMCEARSDGQADTSIPRVGMANYGNYAVGLSNHLTTPSMPMQIQQSVPLGFVSDAVFARDISTDGLQNQRPQHVQEQQIEMSSTNHNLAQDSSVWSDSSFADLPSWAMSDFEFEQAFTNAGLWGSTNFGSLGLSEFDIALAQSMDNDPSF